jgi:hypothetical protein
MSISYAAVQQQKKMLGNLDAWIEKAIAFAKTKSFDPQVLLSDRLAPDMFPLTRQVQAACDNAKFTAARLSGKEPPKHPDTEQTIDEVRARIRTVLTYLETFKASDFDGAETRQVNVPALEGRSIPGLDYLLEFVQPNFYFHVTMAYAILRNNGVDVGKRDYLGAPSALNR